MGCSPWGSKESDRTERLHFHFSLSCIGEGNGNPLQCSCLENPRDGGAWWAALSEVAQSWTRLKRLSSSSSSNHVACYPQSASHSCDILNFAALLMFIYHPPLPFRKSHHLQLLREQETTIHKRPRSLPLNLRYADDNTLMAESKEELKSLLMKVKEESEKAGLKLNI